MSEIKIDEERVEEIINKLRPYIQMDGGDVEYVKVEDGYVYVRVSGACVGCFLIDQTITGGIEQYLKEEIPEIKGVLVLQDSPSFTDPDEILSD